MSQTSIVVKPNQFIKDLERYGEEVADKCLAAMMEAEDTLISASLEQVPRDTGSLAASTFSETTKTSNSIEGIVGYGGGNEQINPKTRESTAEYAVQVHEDLSMPHPRGGKAKFLEDPSIEMKDKFTNIVREALR